MTAVLAAVHAGEGRVRTWTTGWAGVWPSPWLRDPDDLVARFERAGFTVTDRRVRAAYSDEHPTARFHLVGVGYS
jgi:hypothetical protein